MRASIAGLRHPLVHFLFLGAVLFGLTRAFGGGARSETHGVAISASRLEEIRQEEIGRIGREPAPSELERAVEAAIAEEVLYREALARRLDEGDAVIERRLLQNMRFLADDPGQDPAALLRQAHVAGLQHGDPVVRRRLVQKMRALLESEGRRGEPREAELRAYYDAHAVDFEVPPSVVLEHIFHAGPGALDAARATLAELQNSGSGAGAAAHHGQPFFAGTSLPPHSQGGLSRLFGEGFAAQVMTLPVGRWAGPITSAYGAHLVFIHEKLPGRRLPFEAVRERVRLRVIAESEARALAAGIARLRQQYAVTFERR